MSPKKKTKLPYRWQRRIYLVGCLLCVGMLGALGLWILFLTPPETTPDGWLAETTPLDEERAGYSGGRARIAPGFRSNGKPHNEGARQPQDTVNTLDSEPTVVAPLHRQTHTLAAPTTASASPRPGRANRVADAPAPSALAQAQPALSESGVGEITITALMPGARVDVADHVVTEAPTTLQVPWPANYTVAVLVNEATVYETKVHLSAENNRFSFAVDHEAGVD